jgi:hypothetical protein
MISADETESCAGCLSAALAGIVRGKLCDTLLSNRAPVTFEKDDVLYDPRSEDHTFFFLRSGVVKVGTITQDGHEIIYDVRKAGEVVGELAMCGSMLRSDRAVALKRSDRGALCRDCSRRTGKSRLVAEAAGTVLPIAGRCLRTSESFGGGRCEATADQGSG